MTKTALAEDIELKDPQVFCTVHFKVRHGKSFRRVVHRGVSAYGRLRNEYAACMDGEVCWQFEHPIGVTKYQFGDVVAFSMPLRLFNHRVDFMLGKSENLSEFSQHRTPLIGDVRAQQANVILSVFFK